MIERHKFNAPGDWYVDTNCINCKAAQTVAPGLIVERGGQSVFAKQPETEEELTLAWRARLLCPTASVRSESHLKPPSNVFPEPMTDGVYRLGYNARNSWGAHSFLIRRTRGNAMIDAPRWTQALADTLAEWGGLDAVLLTHRDDVADADRYAKHFGARVFIHADDKDAAPYATEFVSGRDPLAIDPEIEIIPVPGHTKGSVAYRFGLNLFTGDSLSWDFATGDLRAGRRTCWYSWPEQIASLSRLTAFDFDWVFAGHGGSKHLPVPEMRARLEALTVRMAKE